jgi:serine/threonine protein kinase
VDFYALGVTLFKAATGEVPFNAGDWFELARMHVEEPPPSLRKKRAEISKRLERVVVKCLAKHPDDRYQTDAELAADLDEVQGGKRPTFELGAAPIASTEFIAPRNLRQPKRRGPLLAFVLVGVALIVAIALLIRSMR